jgi:phage repressor protein C with HTH and peptisase S24 domain
MLPVYRDGDRIVVSPSASARRIELLSFNPSFEDRVFELTEVSFIHRIIWSSQ